MCIVYFAPPSAWFVLCILIICCRAGFSFRVSYLILVSTDLSVKASDLGVVHFSCSLIFPQKTNKYDPGFCIICFAAVAVFHALETLGCKKVAMLDFDVHHGNGIAALVREDPRVGDKRPGVKSMKNPQD